MRNITRNRLSLPAVVFGVAAGLLLASPAFASPERQGAEVLDAVQSGERDCDRLDEAEFAAVGEYAMGRMIGSAQAHESMDELMARMMGEGNSERMHEVMGERFTGCGNPSLPGGYAEMMGMMGMMGGGFGPGAGSGAGFGPGGMMGFSAGDRDVNDDGWDWDHMDWDGGWWILGALGMVLFWVLVVLGIVWLVRSLSSGSRRAAGRGTEAALDVLDRRLAEGAISPEEYRERRAILTGKPGDTSG